MRKISNFFYFMFFLALSFPAKALGQTKYGVMPVEPQQVLYGVYPDPTPIDRIAIIGRWAAIILVPIALIILIILGIRKIRKKK